MAIITGAAFGNVISQLETYLEGAPNIYFGDIDVPYMFNPDSNGFYWQLSGTTNIPVYQLGCYENVQFGDQLTINAVRCDTIGDKDVIIKRDHLSLKFTLKSFLPFTNIAPILGGGAVTHDLSAHTEAFGIGIFDNSKFYKIYFPKVYDQTDGSYVAITGHRCKFIWQGEWSMSYGQVWSLPMEVWLMADESKPTDQAFATVLRFDPNNL